MDLQSSSSNSVGVSTRRPATRQAYTASQKLEVIKFAEEHGNRAAERHFKVAEKCVRLWRKNKVGLSLMPPTKMACRRGKMHWPELEEELKGWVLQKKINSEPINSQVIRMQALRIAREKDIGAFHATQSWFYNFMNRNNMWVFIPKVGAGDKKPRGRPKKNSKMDSQPTNCLGNELQYSLMPLPCSSMALEPIITIQTEEAVTP